MKYNKRNNLVSVSIGLVLVAFILPSKMGIAEEVGQTPISKRKSVVGLKLASYEHFDAMRDLPVNNQDYVNLEASKYGWDSGNEWNALYTLINNESGWRTNAVNASSNATGLFQFLDSTWGSYGCTRTFDVIKQAECGLKYIKARYGSPSRALAFWYAQGPQHWY